MSILRRFREQLAARGVDADQAASRRPIEETVNRSDAALLALTEQNKDLQRQIDELSIRFRSLDLLESRRERSGKALGKSSVAFGRGRGGDGDGGLGGRLPFGLTLAALLAALAAQDDIIGNRREERPLTTRDRDRIQQRAQTDAGRNVSRITRELSLLENRAIRYIRRLSNEGIINLRNPESQYSNGLDRLNRSIESAQRQIDQANARAERTGTLRDRIYAAELSITLETEIVTAIQRRAQIMSNVESAREAAARIARTPNRRFGTFREDGTISDVRVPGGGTPADRALTPEVAPTPTVLDNIMAVAASEFDSETGVSFRPVDGAIETAAPTPLITPAAISALPEIDREFATQPGIWTLPNGMQVAWNQQAQRYQNQVTNAFVATQPVLDTILPARTAPARPAALSPDALPNVGAPDEGTIRIGTAVFGINDNANEIARTIRSASTMGYTTIEINAGGEVISRPIDASILSGDLADRITRTQTIAIELRNTGREFRAEAIFTAMMPGGLERLSTVDGLSEAAVEAIGEQYLEATAARWAAGRGFAAAPGRLGTALTRFGRVAGLGLRVVGNWGILAIQLGYAWGVEWAETGGRAASIRNYDDGYGDTIRGGGDFSAWRDIYTSAETYYPIPEGELLNIFRRIVVERLSFAAMEANRKISELSAIMARYGENGIPDIMRLIREIRSLLTEADMAILLDSANAPEIIRGHNIAFPWNPAIAELVYQTNSARLRELANAVFEENRLRLGNQEGWERSWLRGLVSDDQREINRILEITGTVQRRGQDISSLRMEGFESRFRRAEQIRALISRHGGLNPEIRGYDEIVNYFAGLGVPVERIEDFLDGTFTPQSEILRLEQEFNRGIALQSGYLLRPDATQPRDTATGINGTGVAPIVIVAPSGGGNASAMPGLPTPGGGNTQYDLPPNMVTEMTASGGA